jgi:folate-binding protein YgfZ
MPDFYDLSPLGKCRISGEDACDFLQGQLSNDIDQLSNENPHQMSAYCNPKGRMLALFQILKIDTGYVLIAPREILDKVLPRLKMFVMRAAVKIEPLENMVLYGLRHSGEPKDVALAALQQSSTLVAKHCNDPNRFLALGAERTDIELISANEWNILDIQQNLPQIYIESHEALIPQSVNLDIVGGVNFKKGCFPGQEIIARIRYRGKPKTRMIGVRISTDQPVKIGTSVYIDDRRGSAGQVVNLAEQSGECLLSISIPVSHAEQGAVYLDEAKTMRFDRLVPAYEIPL